MIQLLATHYQRRIALLLFLFMDLSFVFSPLAKAAGPVNARYYYPSAPVKAGFTAPVATGFDKAIRLGGNEGGKVQKRLEKKIPAILKHKNIGGPGQPEMSSFKSVSSDNMVSLFTGDFNYNIPLLDVGGYPVNMFYAGEIGMEQEASWVGLGWNINPGNINRNMRGVPDDFNGDEVLTQQQNIKPNKTWGVSVGGDLEVVGTKFINLTVGGSIGVSFNNYLGPALDAGVKGGVSFKVADKVTSEKGVTDSMALKLSANVSADLNSRSGLTLSPSVSLTANSFTQDRSTAFGLGLSTSYNSRSGIKALQISEQMSLSKYDVDCKIDAAGKTTESVNYSKGSTDNARLFSTSISFARPSYLPAMRIPMSNSAFSGHFQLGGAIWGLQGSVEAEMYLQRSEITASKVTQKKPMVGYLYYEKAMDNPNAVMDFTRYNDREVTAHTSIISASQYTYDVFSIQGEGTGGSIRAYRNDLGYVRDNATGSQDQNTGIGVDIGIIGQYGANFNLVKTPSTIGEWTSGNKLHTPLKFRPAATSGTWENVYFRNPGESSVLNDNQYTRMGGTDLVRFELAGDGHNPVVAPMLDRFSKAGSFIGSVNATNSDPSGRKKRTQVIDFLTADNATNFGLDKQIKSYDNQTLLDASNNLIFTATARSDGGNRLGHHISQINVTESNGKRYVYGIPVYNTMQEDFTFTVKGPDTSTPGTTDKVLYTSGENTIGNSAITDPVGGKDGYVQITQTPAYAHSFLLSGLLSPDYVDVTGDGISDDDMGNAVKFNYTEIKGADGNPAVHKWRTPVDNNMANFNAGNRTEIKDDKGIVSYGERESWYLHSIESKTMIAIFKLSDRLDGKGVNSINGGVNSAETALKKLDSILLYSKSDLKKNGLAKAKPIKTVHFTYSYTLCPGTPDNPSGAGKLTLENIYFTFNGQSRINKNNYVFSYVNPDATGNPGYVFGASDRWGTYKLPAQNPQSMLNSEYPYTPQQQQGQASPKTLLDQNAGAWALKKILLPSGGQIEVTYESDDYAFVQNRRAADMMAIAGFGSTPTTITNRLYDISWVGGITENNYLFVSVPTPCANATEVYQRYLLGMDQLSVKLAVNMPKGLEYVTSYANIDSYGVYDATKIWIRLKKVNGYSPLSLTAIEYLREQLPGQAFAGYDVSESSGLQQVGEMMIGMLDALKDAFKDPANALRSAGKAQTIQLLKSFTRLNDPAGYKYGGGQRVKSVRLKDNWKAMTNQFTSVYGQDYDYTTTEVFNGISRKISSGVASYEPTIGGDENPFQTIVQVADKLPLGPTSYGAIEMPVLDAFFPAPCVGYSKVTVTSLPSSVKDPAQQKSRSGIGRQVTEFYTAKDFPVYYSQTSFDPSTDIQGHDASTAAFFYKYAFDSRTLSQGFLVETNDMHGKMKSQTSYAENDTNLRVNYTENFYRNTGVNGLNEKLDFVAADQGGVISPGNMGIDIELMTDTREFTVKSNSLEIEGQLDLFPVILPFWLPFIWPVTGNSEQYYRAVTTTKVINYHSILDSVVVFDKGSQVSTKNLVYDGETGAVIVSRTNNEFNQPLYNTNYPAWWAYSGMGLAYKNTDIMYNAGVTFYDGALTTPGFDMSIFESGDELYIYPPQTPASTGCINPSTGILVVWAFDRNKNITSLTSATHDYIFIDSSGKPFTYSNVGFRIGRSGKRNMLDASCAAVTSMISPVVTNAGVQKLTLNSSSKALNASAIEYREKWQTDRDVINLVSLHFDPSTCTSTEVPDCNGYLQKSINPYRKGLLGNFRNDRSLVFYGDRSEPDFSSSKNLTEKGLLSNFKLYWDFNGSNNLVPDLTNTTWTWKDEITRENARGLELETRNALNIYTAAQYGYNKTLPTAITNNALYNEMFYEGFEDNGYSSFLSNDTSIVCPAQQHADLSSLASTQVLSSGALSFTAHTGKYMLSLNGYATPSRTFAVNSTPPVDFSLPFSTDIAKLLNQKGQNFLLQSASMYPSNCLPTNSNFIIGNTDDTHLAVNFSPNDGGPQANGRRYQFTATYTFYMEVTASGTYPFTVNFTGTNHTEDASLSCSIRNVDNSAATYSFSANNCYYPILGSACTNNTGDVTITNIFLCKGIYAIEADVRSFFSCTNGGSNDCAQIQASHEVALTLTTPFVRYQSLNLVDGCSRTVPIPGTDSMLAPVFAVPSDKKMVFSAWVREEQTAASNGAAGMVATYTNTQATVDFVNSGGQSLQQTVFDGSGQAVTPTQQLVTFTPTGPIIEGWQRIEAYFVAPTNAGSMRLRLVNNSSNPAYFDDIRMHPYNADMKSYVYDPVNLRLTAELDANNYASFYEYDEEGTLIRTKAETRQGIKTIRETRSAKQKNIVGDPLTPGSSCGNNCVVAYMQTLAGTATLGYPVGVFNVQGNLLGNATGPAQYVSLWNADTQDALIGTLAAGGDPLHFNITLNAGKSLPALTGCRYYQVDMAWSQLDGVRNTNGSYVDFGDGTGMHLSANPTDVATALPPNTTAKVIYDGQYSVNAPYYIHTYADASLKTLTFYHNDAAENEDLDNVASPATGLTKLINLRGNLPQNMWLFGGSCYQDASMHSVANISNWNSIQTITEFNMNRGDGVNPNRNVGYPQDFLSNNKGLQVIYTSGGYRFSGYIDPSFKLSTLKSDWNTYFTNLKVIQIGEDQWNREDLSALHQLNFLVIYAGTQDHLDGAASPLVAMPSTEIDNIIIQVAAGAGQTVYNGYIGLGSNGGNRTAASDAAVAFLKSRGWSIYLNDTFQ